tara:strand:- start:889 stop:1101 length:213 start_codon:yes stop_codon:yes gene_type:complete
MKKNNDINYSSSENFKDNKKISSDLIKTTNINILLNRVKIEKKNDFKKKIYIISLMFLTICFFSIIAISI